jgi:exodeoxyribonuclease V beta subunit
VNALDPFEVPLHGTQLIEANAGTGKTHTITTLYLRLLLEELLAVDQILVVTYTNAATAELRRKIRERVAEVLAALRGEREPDDPTSRELARRRRQAGTVAGDCQRLEAALYAFDEAAICTIHGFCQRVLQDHAFESGVAFDTELIGDQRLLIDEVVRDLWARELYGAPPELVRFLGRGVSPATLARLVRTVATHSDLRILPARPDVDLAAAIAAGNGLSDALRRRSVQLQLDVVDRARGELRRRKVAAGVQSFDDLLQRLDTALHGPGGEALVAKIHARCPAALIDEFQDTDPVQYRIFESIYSDPRATLFLVGDPKQAIYGFRGADVFAYVRAKRRAGDAARTLNVNRRSSPSLVRAVDTLFGRARAPFILEGIPIFPSQPAGAARNALAGAAAGRAPLRVLFVDRAGRRLDSRTGQIRRGRETLDWFHAAVAGEVTRLLNEDTRIGDRRIGPGDIAVLSRTNNQSADVQERLSALGVPTVMYGDTSVFETAEAAAVERIMRAMADPADATAIAAALLTPILGLSGGDLAGVRSDDRAWETWTERFQAWNECWRSCGFTVAFHRLLDEQGVPARVLARPGGERCLTNVLHLGELLQAAETETRRGPLTLVEWLQRMRADDAARSGEVAESAQIRLESDTDALKLITIHKSKGLQYPVVVCPFLWDGMLLHPDDFPCFHPQGGELTLDLGSECIDRHREIAEREVLAETVRLLYVALTRAEQLCLVVWGQFKTCETAALGYVLHQPADVPEETLVGATRERMRSLSDAEMRGDLERLVSASAGAVESTDLALDPPARFTPVGGATAPLRLRRMSHDLAQRWRMASFSALAAADEFLPGPAEEGIDHDEMVDQPSPRSEETAALLVRGLPRGRPLGNLVHKLFETVDFADRDVSALRDHAAPLLPRYGVDAACLDALCAAITDVLDTPLTAGTPPLTLRQIPADRRLHELEFVFPVALGVNEAPAGTITAAHLAEVFARHGVAEWLARDYAERMRRLPFAPLAGYLKGFIDLVFVHDRRWFVVDYKTNDLGLRAADYRSPRLLAEMQRHHYVLQYHLYCVALHRYLHRRLHSYTFEHHFGGVLYLFVRGMAPHHDAGCGVFFDRPPAALITALSDVLARPAERVDGLRAS